MLRPDSESDGARRADLEVASELPALTNAALESARWNPEVGCLIDTIYPGSPLLVSFGFLGGTHLPLFDFFGRSKKLENRFDLKLNRILIRDCASSWYHRGVPGLGTHIDAVAATLRGMICAIRPSRVMTIGQSMGGYAAILFGMLAEADRIIAFGPLAHLNPARRGAKVTSGSSVCSKPSRPTLRDRAITTW